ncbi:MAG: hypothetical protein JNM03_00015 [Sphingopyxis sp.]|uniref:P-loop NTPase fold protein n=1 Tax=Sphingopyxis sp. TaxID=1908224 RepID=UPI001A549548|nr:P-loop NTPase fold protein [Sphingopyxis sp.]MBL9068359.1 hypothetical protein [Sphingopyxis sp.]
MLEKVKDYLLRRRETPAAPPANAGTRDPEAEAGGDNTAMQADRPIERKAEDIFDRAPFAEQIAGIIAGRVDPSSLVIGLYGPWGDGKTSTLAMIRESLENNPDIIAMDYNPWFYGDTTEQLTRSFFASIQAKLEKSGYFTLEKIGSVMETFGGGVPYVGEGIKNVGKAMTTEALTDARDKLGEILRRHRKKVVIFVDDIDRLDRADIQTLFKLVRLSGGFDHTTYILAFDDAVVAEALGQAYGSGDPVAGRRFLEKIVQVPLHLPPVRREKLRDLMFAACDRTLSANQIELKEGEGSELGHALASGFVHALKTPRQVKLLDNALSFAVPLLKDEVRAVDQVQIEALRIFYPELYEAVRKSPDTMLRSREQREGQRLSPVEAAIDALKAGEDEKKAVRDFLIGLFPRFSTMGYGDDWDASWNAEKRICGRDYFPRYFGYAVPQGDISDKVVDELVGVAAAGDVGAARVIVADSFTLGAAELLVRKLRSREETLPIDASLPIIRAVASNAASIPVTRDIMMGDFVLSQAATLVTRLAARADAEQQDSWLAAAIEDTDSLFFASHIVRRSLAEPKRPNDRASLPALRVERLGALMLGRLRAMARQGDIFEQVGDRIGRVFNAIRSSGSEATQRGLRELLAETLAADASNAVRFVKAFAGRTQGGDGVTRISDLTRDNYRGLATVFDMDALFAQLEAAFGEEIAKAEWREADGNIGDDDRRIAEQFAFLHLNPAAPDGDEIPADD